MVGLPAHGVKEVIPASRVCGAGVGVPRLDFLARIPTKKAAWCPAFQQKESWGSLKSAILAK
jgi:hypothetical protein